MGLFSWQNTVPTFFLASFREHIKKNLDKLYQKIWIKLWKEKNYILSKIIQFRAFLSCSDRFIKWLEDKIKKKKKRYSFMSFNNPTAGVLLCRFKFNFNLNRSLWRKQAQMNIFRKFFKIHIFPSEIRNYLFFTPSLNRFQMDNFKNSSDV